MIKKHLICQFFSKFTCFCFRLDNYPPNCHQPGISLPLALHWLFRDNSIIYLRYNITNSDNIPKKKLFFLERKK